MFRSTIGRAATAAVLALTAAVGAARAGGAFQNGLPEEAVHKLKELIRHDAHVKCIAFTATGGWVVLYDDNGFFAKGIPDDTFAKLKGLAENGAVLRWVAFTPSDGFVILADKSGFFARGLPAAAALRLKTASDNGEELKSMTFVGKNGWVLIWDGGFAAEGLPRDLFQQLQKLSTAGAISRASPSRRAAAGPCCSIATVPLTATSPTPRSPRSTSCKGSAAFASPASPSRPTPITAGCCSWIRVRPGVSSFSRDPKGSAGTTRSPSGRG